MGPAGAAFDEVVAGMCAGAALVGAIAFARSRLPTSQRIALVLTCGSGVFYLVNYPLRSLIAEAPLWLALVPVILGAPTPAFFWLASRTVFDDRRVTVASLAPAFLLIAANLLGALEIHHTLRSAAAWTDACVSLLVTLHALYLTARGWKHDLVEQRRRLRGPLLLVFALAAATLVASIALLSASAFGSDRSWMHHSISIVLIAIAAAFSLLFDVRRPAFVQLQSDRPAQAAQPDDAIDRLRRLMDVEALWRRETLSVRELATEMGLPEHRLRLLINSQLGYRNFTAFVNAYRIEAAKRALTDREKSSQTVAQIAYDVGYGSLNPFNRAFKEATGHTPRSWRERPSLVEQENIAEP